MEVNYLRSSGYDARPLEGSRQAGFRTVKSLDFVREEFTEIDGTHFPWFLPPRTLYLLCKKEANNRKLNLVNLHYSW